MGLRYLIGSFFVSSSPSISEGFEESNGYIKRNLGLKGDFVPKKDMPKGEQMWSNPLHETTLEHENGLYIYRTPNSMHIWWQGQHFQGCKRRNSGTGLDDGPENTPIFSWYLKPQHVSFFYKRCGQSQNDSTKKMKFKTKNDQKINPPRSESQRVDHTLRYC